MFLSGKERCTSTLVVLNTAAGPRLIKQSFALTTCFLSIKQMKALRVRSDRNSLFEEMGMVTMELKLRQLRIIVGFLVVSTSQQALVQGQSSLESILRVWVLNLVLSPQLILIKPQL